MSNNQMNQLYRPDRVEFAKRNTLIAAVIIAIAMGFAGTYIIDSTRESREDTGINAGIMVMVLNLTMIVVAGAAVTKIIRAHNDAKGYAEMVKELKSTGRIGPVGECDHDLWELQWQLIELTTKPHEETNDTVKLARMLCEKTVRRANAQCWLEASELIVKLKLAEREAPSVIERSKARTMRERLETLENQR